MSGIYDKGAGAEAEQIRDGLQERAVNMARLRASLTCNGSNELLLNQLKDMVI